jgi:hypothetical protein
MRKCVTVWGLMTMMNYDSYLDATVNSAIHVINITYHLVYIDKIRALLNPSDSDSTRSYRG